jgi:hypothetical protein
LTTGVSSSDSIASLLGAGVKLCEAFLLFLLTADLTSAARCAGDDAGSAAAVAAGLRWTVEGVDGEDFWKNPRIDRWFFIFCVLEVDRFKPGVVAAAGDDAAFLAIVSGRRSKFAV